MNIHFITFSDEKYQIRQKELENFAINSKKFKTVTSYTKNWLLQTDFYEENKDILDLSRGCGYWLWKPFIIKEKLQEIDKNDIIFYIDCGDWFNISIVDYILQKMQSEQQHILFHEYEEYKNSNWTKKDCFVLMSCDEEKYWNGKHVEAGILFIKNSEFSNKIISEWLEYCKNKFIVTDIDNKFGSNTTDFRDHRHDQSILTNLKIKYNLSGDPNIFNLARCNVR